MATRMQQRRATAEQWLLADPILAAGEIGYETDTRSFKIGDGINTYSLLDYFETSAALSGTIDDYVPLTQKGAALGVATLDGSGKVPSAQLPDLDELSQDAINTALTAGTGITKDYDDAANTLTLEVDTDVIATKQYVDDEIAAIPAPDYTGLATETYVDDGLDTKADSVHTHAISDVTGLQTALDSKLESSDLTGYATETYVGTQIANLVDSAPAALDTLNELAAALGDDENFASTITNSLATKKEEVSEEISVNTNLVAGYRYYVDTATALTLTLPATPAVNDEIWIIDQSSLAATNNITVNNNGSLINGVSDTLVIDANGAVAALVYTGATLGWRV